MPTKINGFDDVPSLKVGTLDTIIFTTVNKYLYPFRYILLTNITNESQNYSNTKIFNRQYDR